VTTWAPLPEDPKPDKVPILSKFNEQTQRFEFDPGILEIPVTQEQYFLQPEIILDQQDIFWIFAQRDGIYRYDPPANHRKTN
jgi:hypothetical protein